MSPCISGISQALQPLLERVERYLKEANISETWRKGWNLHRTVFVATDHWFVDRNVASSSLVAQLQQGPRIWTVNLVVHFPRLSFFRDWLREFG